MLTQLLGTDTKTKQLLLMTLCERLEKIEASTWRDGRRTEGYTKVEVEIIIQIEISDLPGHPSFSSSLIKSMNQ